MLRHGRRTIRPAYRRSAEFTVTSFRALPRKPFGITRYSLLSAVRLNRSASISGSG
jgi:hypothetical protein